jgi:hypothetical protein
MDERGLYTYMHLFICIFVLRVISETVLFNGCCGYSCTSLITTRLKSRK